MARNVMFLFVLAIHLSSFSVLAESQEKAIQDARRKLDERNIPFTVEEFMNGARRGDSALVELFMDAGMYYNARDVNRWTPLMWAASEGHTDTVRFLLNEGADVDAKSIDGWTALMLADVAGHSNTVQYLLEYGAKAYPGYRLQLALIEATVGGDAAAVKELLDSGADPNVEDEHGHTVLMFAATKGSIEIVKALLDHGADVNREKRIVDLTALMLAAGEGHINIVKRLLDAGADVDAKNRDGGTALMFAASGGHTEIVRLLLKEGANVNAQNTRGWTALMLATKKGHTDVVRTLIEKGAVVNLKNSEGSTAMMGAVSGGYPDIVSLLRRTGAKGYPPEGAGDASSVASSEEGGTAVASSRDASVHTASTEAQAAESKGLVRDESTYMEADFNELRQWIGRLACAQHLKQLSLILHLFAAENKERFPRIDDVRGNFMFEGSLIYPGYLKDVSILGCPWDSGYKDGITFRLKSSLKHPRFHTRDVHPDCITSESYIYLGWMVTTEEEGLAAIEAYLASSSEKFEQSLTVQDGKGTLGTTSIRRLSSGADRFLSTDVNSALKDKPSPASQIPLMWEWPTNHENGGNVLYLDGHVEFVPYPGKFPMTERFIKALREIDVTFSEDVLGIATR